jgi:nucleotide-binding universal stress UspA family protein
MATNSAKVNFKRILLPTDFTEASAYAASYALNMALQYKARLFVLHVVDLTEDAAGFYVPHVSFSNLDKELKDVGEVMLKKFCAKRFKGFNGLVTKVLVGEPYKEIVKSIKKDKIDVVVMGTFGKGGLDRFFFGSTTDRVLRKTDCPVLVVPPSS